MWKCFFNKKKTKKKKKKKKAMLTKSLWLACLWFSNSWVQGQLSGDPNCTVDEEELPEVQTGINNFVIDRLGLIEFPYAIGECTANDVLDTGRWYTYQCDMDSASGMSTVIKTEFFDDACFTDGIVIEIFNETNMTEGTRGFFECSGSNTHAKLRMGLDSECDSTTVIYAALGACSNFGQDSQINLYCSDNETIVQVFTFQGQMPTSTFLPSSTFFPTGINATVPTLLNGTLPTLLNGTVVPTSFNATLPTSFLNATLPTMFNMSTTQIGVMWCADEAFCDKWVFVPNQCREIATIAIGVQPAKIYGIMDECFTDTDMVSSTTTIEFTSSTTVTDNVSATEPTAPTSGSTSTTSTGSSTTSISSTQTTSGAVRPSLLFTVGMFFSLFFLVTI